MSYDKKTCTCEKHSYDLFIVLRSNSLFFTLTHATFLPSSSYLILT